MQSNDNNKKKSPSLESAQTFPIVGIGASAGGLNAFTRLLKAIPENSGMAYVLVQHLDRSRESLLPEILQRVTKTPVHEVTDDIQLAPDHIYIISSNKMLTSKEGALHLIVRDKKILNHSIDGFFTSMAEVHKELAVGVVLSGTGADGTIGLKTIKEHGGITIAQDVESADYDSMPQSAIQAGVVDFILTPEKIPAQLSQINKTYKSNHFFNDEKQFPEYDEDIFNQILLLLRRGVDFTYYKQPTLRRRIIRRITILKKKNFVDYLKFLRTDKAEQDALFHDLLIPVTSFFRDPKIFQLLSSTVFPSLIKNLAAAKEGNSKKLIRVWIAGCSSGEEAISIAICLYECLGDTLSDTKIQIFASDISEIAIKKARSGIYTRMDVEKLSAIQLSKYFVKSNNGYEVVKFIQDMCVYSPHNFLKDPPFAKMDFISCRNVLIYMDNFLQRKALTMFHYALKPTGFLLLGNSESVSPASELFVSFDKHNKIFSRKQVTSRFIQNESEPDYHPPAGLAKTGTHKDEVPDTIDLTIARLPETQGQAGRPSSRLVASQGRESKSIYNQSTYTELLRTIEQILISKSPASVVVNELMDIVHIQGFIEPFLEAPQGKPSHNLMKMARDGLAFELRNAIHKAKENQASVIKEDIPVKRKTRFSSPVQVSKNGNGSDKYWDGEWSHSLVTIEIIPLKNMVEPHYLILFGKKIIHNAPEAKKSSFRKAKDTELQNRIEYLEKELTDNRENTHSITEAMETANEELQRVNEEMQSSNEEMLSLNEELETSKEELQSANEELIIVNRKLLDREEQLNINRHYSESIVATIREPLLVLDKSLRVKTANASFYKKFNTEEQYIEGKLFYEMQNHQWDDYAMRSLLETVLTKHKQLTDFEIILKFPELGERHLLLNARQIINEISEEQLILLAIEDITERKLLAKQLHQI